MSAAIKDTAKPNATATTPDLNQPTSDKNELSGTSPNSDAIISETKEAPATEKAATNINSAVSISETKPNINEAKDSDAKSNSTNPSLAQESGDKVQTPEKTYPNGVLKTVAQIEGVNNSKYDPSILPTTDDPKKIRAQVEFYFGDANLPTDKYMWGLTEGSSNLPVPIKKICEFGRMRRFSPYSTVVSALKESTFLEVSGEEGEEVVKRKVAYDSNTPRSKTESRSIYVKGFGDEEPSSQFDIEAFFAPHGPTNAVRLRRTPEKLFKGSVFVEFADEETAQKFLDLPTKPLWKGEHELIVMSKKAYTDMKLEDIKSGKIDPAGREFWSQGRGRGRGRGNSRGGTRDSRGNSNSRKGNDRDSNDWKKRRDEDRASGFKDDHHRNHGNNGRGRGRGRRENRRGRDGKGRNNDRNQERETKNDGTTPGDSHAENEGTHKTEKKQEDSVKVGVSDTHLATESKTSSPKKRAREDDGEVGQGASKKLDTKTEVPVKA
ncbi:hypothetical protein K3495_g7325 [Podosphaera aphanis]|nr:hypothetical protein K3495_g7325 [Podosphaera aphanis]